jgi:hypothetical protein
MHPEDPMKHDLLGETMLVDFRHRPFASGVVRSCRARSNDGVANAVFG